MKNKLLILGGGIKGAALAAVASISGEFDVTLVERQAIASGATSTNHGRLHLGTSGIIRNDESSELVQRRRRASELVRLLPDSITCKSEALYCFEDMEESVAFSEKCVQNDIPFREAKKGGFVSDWIKLSNYARVIQVPEYSFNPARLAGRFAQTSANNGGKIIANCRAERLAIKGGSVVVKCEKGVSVEADVVVNTMARWCNHLDGDDIPHPEIEWFRWRLLCLRKTAFRLENDLAQVIVVMDRERKTPSAIPHESWITLDNAETVPVKTETPEGDCLADWRSIDLADPSGVDAANYDVVRKAFLPLRNYSFDEYREHLFSMAGIQGRLVGARKGSMNKAVLSGQVSNYFLYFGGQASTGLLDAIDIFEDLSGSGYCSSVARDVLVKKLVNHLSDVPFSDSVGMRWEHM
jgi:hypothetical protein